MLRTKIVFKLVSEGGRVKYYKTDVERRKNCNNEDIKINIKCSDLEYKRFKFEEDKE